MTTLGELTDRLEQLCVQCGKDTPVYYYICGGEYPLGDIMQVSFYDAEPVEIAGDVDLPDRVLIN